MRRVAHFLAGLTMFLTGCSLGAAQVSPTSGADRVGTLVAATLAAIPSSTPARPTPTLTPNIGGVVSPTPGLGNVSGKVCYPSGASAVTAYFEDSASHVVNELGISGGLPSYTIDLPPATYTAYSWLNDFSLGGSYSKCGATPGCNGATPLPFVVLAGQSLSGIDLCDWSHGPFDIPYPPGHTVQSTTGIISGSISGYPSGNLPTLTIVAFNRVTGYWYWVGTANRQASYSITDLPPGSYQVVAYDSGNHGGGSPVVAVTAGDTAIANISDWAGSYPDNPVP